MLEGMLEALTEQASRDSSGRFTLDPRKAIEKLSGFQLYGGQWALKIVQAAVAGGASSLELSFRGKDALWKIKGVAWSADDVEDALWHPEAEVSRGLHHLRVALWSVGFGQKKSFELAGPGWKQSLGWNGRRLQLEPTAERDLFELRVTGITPGDLTNPLLVLARPCPIPFTVAGRSLKSGRSDLDPLFSGYPRPELFCQLYEGPPEARLFHWVKDGVSVGSYYLEGDRTPICGDFFLADPAAPTDLSGLRLVASQMAEVIPATDPLLAGCFARLHEQLLERVGEPEPVRRNNVTFWESIIVVGAISMITTDPAFGGCILLAGVLGVRLNPAKVSPRVGRAQQLADYLEKLKDEPWRLSERQRIVAFVLPS